MRKTPRSKHPVSISKVMPALSDAVLIGTVLTLIFGAVAYYLYTRICQNESKVSLMESILLNLKMATEATLLAGAREEMHFAAHHNHTQGHVHMAETGASASPLSQEEIIAPSQPDEATLYQQMIEEAHNDIQQQETKDVSVHAATSSPSVASTPSILVTKDDNGNSKVHIGFESMSYKELCGEAQKRGITGVSRMNRRKLIDVLNKKEGIVSVEESAPVTTTDKLFDLPPAQEFPDGVELASL
jgi:hypothetical protein